MRREAPSLNDLLFFNELMEKPQHRETQNEINVVPEAPLEAGNEIDVSELLNDLFSQKDQTAKVNPETPKKTDNKFDVPEFFISAPQKQEMKHETKAPLQTETEIDISELLHDLFPQKEQKVKKAPKTFSKSFDEIKFSELLKDLIPRKEQSVNVVPKSRTKSNSEFDGSELIRDLISEEQKMGHSSSNAENDVSISKLLHDLQNEEVGEVFPAASPKTGKELDMSDLIIEIIPQRKEPEEPVVVEIEEEIISIMPLNDLTTDEKKKEAPTPTPNLDSTINKLLFNIISPLEQRLLDEFERALVPLNYIMELGENIKNSPFTEEEIKKLGLCKVYIQTTQEMYIEFKSQVSSFGVNRFYETAVQYHYHLSEKQKKHAINMLKDATSSIEAESKAIYDLILKPENQQLIKSIENKQLELSASFQAISLALKANYAHLIDDDKMEDVKAKRLSIIEENSKLMIDILQSKALENLKDGVIEHVDRLVNIMNKLPMKITLSYMF